MFSNIFFVILALLTVSMSGDSPATVYTMASGKSLWLGLTVYTVLLALITVQDVWMFPRSPRSRWPTALVSVQLVLYCLYLQFFLGAQRGYVWSFLPQTTTALPPLALYFGGLTWHHYLAARFRRLSSYYLEYALNQTRFLLPFCIPFLAFALFNDLAAVWSIDLPDGWEAIISGVGVLIFLILLLLFLPPLVVWSWGCTPLPESPLKHSLQALCDRNGFRHAGLLMWTVLAHTPTAAIIGVLPGFRYILFTETLLRTMTPDEVEAIVAHEMGHSYRRHLLIYPLVIGGLVVLATIIFALIGPMIYDFIAMQQQLNPSPYWELARPLAFFIPYGLMLAAYFRIVFGFFSRGFERQADLHVFHAGVPVEHLISALNHVGVVTGNTHDHPSWHHYSIRERITFLEQARDNPQIIEGHHRKVRRRVIGYILLLAVGAMVAISPYASKQQPFSQIARPMERAADKLSWIFNRPWRTTLTEQRRKTMGLPDTQSVNEALALSFHDYGALSIDGLFEFYAAQHLLNRGEVESAARSMIAAWGKFDFSRASEQAEMDFLLVSERIAAQLDHNRVEHLDEVLLLQRAIQNHSTQRRTRKDDNRNR